MALYNQITKTITLPVPAPQQALSGNVVDLVALLKQSLGKTSAKSRLQEPEPDQAPAPARKPPAKGSARPAKNAAPAKPRARKAV